MSLPFDTPLVDLFVPSVVTCVTSPGVTVPGVVRKKFVGKLKPLVIPAGKPVWKRNVPTTSQPPIRASSKRLALEPNRCPLPKGRSTVQLALMLCLTSKSERARPNLRLNGFWIRPVSVVLLLAPKSAFSGEESLSMDFDQT